MSKSFGAWLIANAGLISVIGALIIFFSWIVTNTLGQRYSRLKQSVETADSNFRLYTSLHELRDSLNSVARETIYAREAAERNLRSANDAEESELRVLRRNYSLTQMSAHQIKELMDFAVQTIDYSSSVGTATDTSQKIETLKDEIYRVYAKARDLDRAVEIANGPSPSLPSLLQALELYTAYVRNDAIPRVGKLYEGIVDLSNKRHEEGREELAQAKRNAGIAANAALALYLVGSSLALGGQYLDKVYKKKVETAPANQAAPSVPSPDR